MEKPRIKLEKPSLWERKNNVTLISFRTYPASARYLKNNRFQIGNLMLRPSETSLKTVRNLLGNRQIIVWWQPESHHLATTLTSPQLFFSTTTNRLSLNRTLNDCMANKTRWRRETKKLIICLSLKQKEKKRLYGYSIVFILNGRFLSLEKHFK